MKVGSKQRPKFRKLYNALLSQSLTKVRAHIKIQLHPRHTFPGDFKMKYIILVFVVLEMIDDSEVKYF